MGSSLVFSFTLHWTDDSQDNLPRCSSSCWPQLSSTSAEVTVWGLTSTCLNTERRTTRRSRTTSSPRLSPMRHPRTMTSWPAPPSSPNPRSLLIPLDFPPTTLALREGHGSVAVNLRTGVHQGVVRGTPSLAVPQDINLSTSGVGAGPVCGAVMDRATVTCAIATP